MRSLLAALALLGLATTATAQPLVYTGPGDGITDNTAIFNTAVSNVCASATTRTLYLPAGKYRFASPPTAIPCALNLVGEGKAVTWLIRDYSGMGSYFLKIIGGQDAYGGGKIQDLAIYTSPNGIGGIAIWVLPSPDADPTVLTKNPHGLLIDNIMIGKWSTAGGSWAFGIYLDGTNNPGPGAIGARAIAIRNTSVSSFTSYPFYLNAAYGTRMTEVDGYIALGGGQYVVGCTNSTNTTLISGTLPLGC